MAEPVVETSKNLGLHKKSPPIERGFLHLFKQ